MKEKLLKGIKFEELQKLTKTKELLTYPKLCEKIGITNFPSNSTKRIKQLTELGMVCEYEKKNRKYQIIYLRSESEIWLYQKREHFISLFEYCISEKFLQKYQNDNLNIENQILFFTIPTLLEWCGIIHPNYLNLKKYKGNKKDTVGICFKYGIEPDYLTDFMNISYQSVLKPLIRTALKSLDNKHAIVIHKGFKIYTYTKNKVIYKNILGTSELGQQLEHIIAQGYTKYNIKKSQDLFFAGEAMCHDFYDWCNKQCKKQLGYDGFFDCYAIVINPERAKATLQQLQTELNHHIQQRFLDSVTMKVIPQRQRNALIQLLVDLESDIDVLSEIEEYQKYKLAT